MKNVMAQLGSRGLWAFLLCGSLTAQEIRSERVRFEPGARSATLENSLQGYEIADYLLQVQSGQYLNVSMATDNGANYFNLMEPGETEVAVFNGSLGGNQFEGTADRSGEYRIRVYLMRSAARRNETAHFRLEMIVGPLENPDARVPGTSYHATGQVPCIMQGGQSAGYCDFGVVREGNGSGRVTVTKPDGGTRTLFFEDGNATGYDQNQARPAEFRASKEGDRYMIRIGDEQYEIPEAVIYGG